MASEEEADYFLETSFREADRFDSADIISTVEFDHTGNYLATGDKGGRVVLFERNETVRQPRVPLSPPLPENVGLTNFGCCRKKLASISFTPSFNPTSLNSTT